MLHPNLSLPASNRRRSHRGIPQKEGAGITFINNVYLTYLKHVTYVKALRSIRNASVVMVSLKFLSVVRCLTHIKLFFIATNRRETL